MQTLLYVLYVVSAAAAATIPIVQDQPSSRTQYPITSGEYLRKILDDTPGMVAMTELDVAGTDVVSLFRSLQLMEAAEIAEQVNMDQILTENGLDSYTIFAPTDSAVQIWKEQVPEVATDRDALADLCRAWIVPGIFQSSEIKDEKVVRSLRGAQLRFNIYNQANSVTVNGAEIVEVDNRAKNAMVHVVDKVLFPLPEDTIFNTLAKIDNFSMFVDLLKQTDLEQEMERYHGWTLFAPTNGAFLLDTESRRTLEGLVEDETKLKQFLQYYMVKGTRYSAGLVDGQSMETLDDNQMTFDVDKENREMYLNKNSLNEASRAKILYADLPATDGVFHVIDSVMLPPLPPQHVTFQL